MKKCFNCWSWLMTVAGVLFGLTTLGLVDYDFVRFWPVLLVVWGLGKVMGHSCMECKM